MSPQLHIQTGFPFFSLWLSWMKILEMSQQIPCSEFAFAVRGGRVDGSEASSCGQHWRLGDVDLSPHLRPLQHNLLGGLQARRTHRALQAQLITKVQPGLSQPYSLFFRPWTNKLYPEYTLVIFPLNRKQPVQKKLLIWDFRQFFAFHFNVQGFTYYTRLPPGRAEYFLFQCHSQLAICMLVH